MKRLLQIISLLLMILVIFIIGTFHVQRKPEPQDGSLYSGIAEEPAEQNEPAVQGTSVITPAQPSRPAEEDIAATEPEDNAPVRVEAKNEFEAAEPEEEGIKIVMITVSEPETDIIPLPDGQSSYSLSEIKGFQIHGNYNEEPLDLIVSSNYRNGSEKIHYLDWDAKHPNQYKLYEPLGYDAHVRVFRNSIQIEQFAVASSSEEEYVALDLHLDSVSEYALAQ